MVAEVSRQRLKLLKLKLKFLELWQKLSDLGILELWTITI